MESSTVLAFRIFVMLACLIIVPMAAIFGSAFPDVVKTVLVDRIVALGTGKTPETKPANNDFGEAPPHPGATPSGASWDAAPPAWPGQGAPAATPWQQPPAAAGPSGVVPA